MELTVLITTSGTGSRLGELTRETNKALVPINGRPGIEYVLNAYPDTTHFVVTLGYRGEQVRSMLTQRYPERRFSFANVALYEGPGSSLGYSMLQARDALQCPFIFHACDTIVTDPIPAPERNWVAGYRLEGDARQYRTHRVRHGKLIRILEKGEEGFDTIHIGLVGIYDYAAFWGTLQELYERNPADTSLNDTPVINALLNKGLKFGMIPFSAWYDTGNPEALAATERALASKHA